MVAKTRLLIFKIKAGEQLWSLQIEGKYCEAANNTILYVVTATCSVQNHSSVEKLHQDNDILYLWILRTIIMVSKWVKLFVKDISRKQTSVCDNLLKF